MVRVIGVVGKVCLEVSGFVSCGGLKLICETDLIIGSVTELLVSAWIDGGLNWAEDLLVSRLD